ncbi:hypothetical protein [Achromobacter xylosoxidans]|uniref:hypothetical protein n=1 Tax=Alcaligenes xylosoxydans xylosoxydans TaxID=85698 RepID=UPI001FF6D2D1|nr:hypothetical protein [Achromobacter xylosoxidans]
MKLALKLLLVLLGVFVASVTLFYAVYGAFTVVNKGQAVAFHFEKSGDLAAWIQAATSFIAIVASACIAVYIQKTDHRNQRTAPVEVAIAIATYCELSIGMIKEATRSLEDLRKIPANSVPFDLPGVRATAKLALDIPVLELRNAEAVNMVVRLGHTMRQLLQHVEKLSGHYHQMSTAAFDRHHCILDTLFAMIKACQKGLEEALNKIHRGI